ncbi:MAG: hypothetical protein JO328_07695 [Hyphomicrobiales bacterium]|nr:hypothetical protein [Hyphomicrobiales bacterium]MBV8825047.1 hypothetical protein [Hyphomicrobiales bacterium]MBV9429878.1 hypothetical protein [Bradyrhizobiaceae bacterium]
MPLSGQGMLITIMDADPAEEADFNRWYDREHIIERTAIPGFLESRRYVAVDGAPKYVNFYTTENIAALDSAPYRAKLDNPTPWTAHHSPRFKNYTRVVGRVTGSKGQGRGAALAFVRVRPPADRPEALRNSILAHFDALIGIDGVISAHLIEADAALSNPKGDAAARAAAGDWYVAVDGTDVDAVRSAAAPRFGREAKLAPGELIAFGTYRLLWDLAKAELYRA